VDVSFMEELELGDRRGVGDGFVGAEIPYASNEYSMLILVPHPGRYQELIDRLDQELLDEIDATFTTGPYELLLPKWDDNYQVDLLAWLTELGAAPGSYPKITPDAFLGTAVHAANITVDEQGTVAAAATGLEFLESGPPEPELTVAADRPFIYVIRHRDSGLVLFAGHVTDPHLSRHRTRGGDAAQNVTSPGGGRRRHESSALDQRRAHASRGWRDSPSSRPSFVSLYSPLSPCEMSAASARSRSRS
jgi:hypothetical protein